MKMAESDDPLERFFEAGRRQAPPPSDALLARIEADALAALAAGRPAPAPALPGWRGLLAALGGWRAGAGLATAALAGLAIGIAVPATTLSRFDALSSSDEGGYELGELGPGYGLALLEDG